MYDIVQSLWIGGTRLSEVEVLTINSFIKNGHEFHLYTYEPLENTPPSTVIKDANEIIPQSKSFTVPLAHISNCYSSFSDFFRWKLILDRGGWWVDLDLVCLKPFEFDTKYVFSGGQGKPGADDCIASHVFKVPKGSPMFQWGWDQCQLMNVQTMTWGQGGPPLLTEAVHKFGFQDTILPLRTFCPIHYRYFPAAWLNPDSPPLPDDAYAIHFFTSQWRIKGIDKNGSYPETSLYEKLKRKFNV
jgi:hypothetical protein